MPATDLTHVTLVLDRSGSMASVRDDAIGGFNAFLESQRGQAGRATLTLVQFDHEYTEVCRATPIAQVRDLDRDSFVPRGNTALYDAVGRAVAETAEHVRSLAEDARPARVLIAILTDGHENASREYTYERVRKVLADETRERGWRVLFLGADMDVVRSAAGMGVAGHSSILYEPSARGTREAFRQISQVASRVRSGVDDDDDDPSGGGGDPGPKLH